MALARITVLVSGRGTNLAALLAAQQRGQLAGAITHVISSRAAAPALDVARARAIATTVVEYSDHAQRAAFDAALAAAIDQGEPRIIVLAGFMRVLGAHFVARFAGRLINIHPSLLPAYPGLHTHRRALADGIAEHGCTVHFVTAGVDQGRVIEQARVAVLAGDDEASLAARVLAAEHQLLPRVVDRYCRGHLDAMVAELRAALPAEARAPT